MFIFCSGLKGNGKKYVMENSFRLFMRLSSRKDDLFWAVFLCFDGGSALVLGS